MEHQALLTEYAVLRARLLLGCYRRADAADPDVYVSAISAVLAKYPEDVITAVTDPAGGLPIKQDFLPTVREVYLACEEIVSPRREASAREERVKRQISERSQPREAKPRPKTEDVSAMISIDSIEARALTNLYAVARIRPAVSNKRVIYPGEVTAQVMAFAEGDFPEQKDWVWIEDYPRSSRWEAFIAKYVRAARPPLVQRVGTKTGFFAPKPWPPNIDGTWPPATELMSEQDYNDLR
jgi:hypothetical protein